MDDVDVEVVDEHDDGGAVEVAAESDVMQHAADAEGDVAVTDPVVTDVVVGLVAAGGGGFWFS